ncbi:hypothetical protein VZT92_011648 [Zoarces viviparus]|uniref:Secreted protein n=1 Tax=Zoarces viviparus TaxID=48416 RepID=A0AAW1F6E1_ZOAVI
MGTSLEVLALLICAPPPRFEQKTASHSAHGPPSLHWETPDALHLQRINQSASTPSSPISPPAACQDSDSSEDCAWGLRRLSLCRPCMLVQLRQKL